MNTTTITKERLTSLYSSGKSMTDISIELNCSIHKVVYWMEKYKIKRRSLSDSVYLKLNPSGDPFKIKQTLSPDESRLYGLGLGIYWGEGEKVSKHSVRVANTDSEMLKVFITFLLDICQIDKSRLTYSIVCFNDSNPNEARAYWAKELKTDENKFGKIVRIPPQGKGNYKRKSQFGVCTVTFSNIKLKAWILNELDRIKSLAGVAQW